MKMGLWPFSIRPEGTRFSILNFTLVGRADLDLPIADARLEAGLRDRCRADDRAPIREGEARAVPGALDAAILDYAVRQRPAQMRAALGQRVDAPILPHKHDAPPADLDPPRLTLDQIAFGQHRRELQRLPDWIGVADTDLIAVDQVAAQIGR